MCATSTKTDADSVAAWWSALKNNGNQAARNKLLEHYLPLVRYAANRLRLKLPSEVDPDDLVSFGTFGLIDAVESFDPDRQIRFETYSASRIHGAMLDGLRTMDWVPRLVRSRARKLQQVTRCLRVKLGREPIEKESARQLALTLKEYRRLCDDGRPVEMTSLNTVLAETDAGKSVCVEHFLGNQRATDPLHSALRNDLKEFVTRGLNRAERLILILYYFEGMTMSEIGQTLDLSESRVSQLHSELLPRLRRRFAGGGDTDEQSD